MRWLTLTCELLTPAFLGGALGGSARRRWQDFKTGGRSKRDAVSSERRTRPCDDLLDELLRPASVVGCLRFWLRAILGARLGDRHPSELRVAEARLFGTGGDNGGQGAVSIRPGSLRPGPEHVISPQIGASEVAPTLADLTTPAGYTPSPFLGPLGYLGYGLFDGASGLALERPVLHAGARLEFAVAIRPRSDLEAWRDLRQTLWLWQTFGGIGARSRRGWGSIQLSLVDDLAAIPDSVEQQRWKDTFRPLSTDEFARRAVIRALHHSGGTAYVGRGYSGEGTDLHDAAPPAGGSRFSHFGHCAVLVPPQAEISWPAAMARAGRAMLAVRSNARHDYTDASEVRVRDHNLVASLLKQREAAPQQADAPNRTAFGLPHNIFFKAFFGRENHGQESLEGAKKDALRRASPVLLSVSRVVEKNGDIGYVPTALWFKSRLTRNGLAWTTRQAGLRDPLSTGTAADPDWRAVVQFLREFADAGKRTGGNGSLNSAVDASAQVEG